MNNAAGISGGSFATAVAALAAGIGTGATALSKAEAAGQAAASVGATVSNLTSKLGSLDSIPDGGSLMQNISEIADQAQDALTNSA